MKTFQTYATVDHKFVDNKLSIHFSENKTKSILMLLDINARNITSLTSHMAEQILESKGSIRCCCKRVHFLNIMLGSVR